MFELVRVREVTTFGCIEDESERDVVKESYYLFDNEEYKEDFLTGFYENQDYTYKVHAYTMFKVEDINELVQIAKCIMEYLLKSI